MSAAEPRVAPPLILASQSPRRAQLLELLGLKFTIVPSAVDETYRPGEEAGAHAERLAREKVLSIAGSHTNALVIGSDTVVVIDDNVLGKPRNEGEALDMLLRLQGREHTVATGIAVASGGTIASDVERVKVWFRSFDERLARAYVATSEPMDKAGAYGIQGYGATLIERIEGDYFAVMGLPILRLLQLLRVHGWDYDFRGLVRT
jgi:septum formation protein